MKQTSLLLSGFLILSAASAVSGAPRTIRNYKQAPEQTLRLPATDTTDNRHKFRNSDLLKARRPFLPFETQDWTTVAADTAGLLNFPKADRDAVLRTFKTNLRARRYARGKMVLKSNVPAEVRLGGNTVITHETADSTASPSEGIVTFMPEVDYEVQVNLLSMPSDPAAPEFSLNFVPDSEFESVNIAEEPDMKRRFEIEDINHGPRVSSTDLSPDGHYLITRYFEVLDATHTRFWATLQETATGRIINPNLDTSYNWMPRGNRLYRCVDMLKNRYDIYVFDVDKGTDSLFARNVPSQSFGWSPDESYIIYYDVKEDEAPAGTMRRYETPDDRLPGYRHRSYPVKYDFATGLATPIAYGGSTAGVLDISADSRKLLISVTTDKADEYPFYFTDVIQMDAVTLQSDTLLRHLGSFSGAVYSPDARTLFITAGPSFMNNLGKNCGDHPIANDFDIQGYLFDINTRSAKAVTRDFDPSISGQPVWNLADNTIYFRGEKGFGYNIYALDPKTLAIRQLETAQPVANNFSIGANESQWLSYTGSSYTSTGSAWLLNLRNGKTRLIDDPMADYLSRIKMGDIQTWTFTSRDGTEIDGRVCLPPDFDATERYPLIVYYYGGTAPCSEWMTNGYAPELLASRGYVVYVLNPSGTTGYGQEFSARHVNAWGDYTADDIIEGVKKFCKAHPYVDDKKIGCMGASYGGFMTQLLQTKTDLFAAAISHAGISNVTSYWGEGFWGYSYNSVAAAQSYPWTNPDLFTKHGSLFNADKIHTPLLLLHGTDDTNVPIGESIQLFNALKVLGREVEFITVDGQNHVITDYEKRKLWHATIMAWFAKWLQDDPQWWNSLYGDK